jgi:hypothetical protein
MIRPVFEFFDKRFVNGCACTQVPEDFEYCSGTNTHWVTVDQLREMVKTL